MAIAYVQNASAYNDGAGTTLESSTFTNTAGNAIVVATGCYHASACPAVSTITDLAGNTYSLIGQYVNNGVHGATELWIAKNATAYTNNKVTVTWASSCSYRTVIVSEYSGVHTTSPTDTSYLPAGQSDNASPYSSASSDTQYNDEVIIGSFYDYASTVDTYNSWDTSTLRASVGKEHAFSDRVAATPGTYGILVASGTNQGHVCLARSLRPAVSTYTATATSAVGTFVSASVTATATGLIDVQSPGTAWTGGTPVSFDIDFSVAGYGFIDWNDTLEAWWRFENEGTTITDRSGKGHDLSFDGSYITGVFGGKAAQLAGTKVLFNKIGCGSLVMKRSSKWTIASWWKMTSDENHNALLHLDCSADPRLYLYRHSGGLNTYVKFCDRRFTAEEVTGLDTVPVMDNTFHHVAWVIDFGAGNITQYIDGVAGTTQSLYSGGMSPLIINNIYIGSQFASTELNNGSVDEMLIFSRALSQAEITALVAVSGGNLTTTIAYDTAGTYAYSVHLIGSDGSAMTTGAKTVTVSG